MSKKEFEITHERMKKNLELCWQTWIGILRIFQDTEDAECWKTSESVAKKSERGAQSGRNMPRTMHHAPTAAGTSMDADIDDLLAEFYTPAEAELWLTSPQPLLDNGIPRDMIAAGQGEAVLACLRRLGDGAYL